MCAIEMVYLQNRACVFAQQKWCICNVAIVYLQYIIYLFDTYNPDLWTIFTYLQYIHIQSQYMPGPKNQIVCVRTSLQNVNFQDFGHFWGRRGSPRAHTLGK